MKPAELAEVRGELVAFAAQMLAPLPRSDQRRWGETYLRGLMLDGRRKSIEPLAVRLADGDEQCLPGVRQPEPLGVGAGARAPGAAHERRDRAARLDHRRYRLSQGGTLLGRRRAPVLGHPRQGRGLPDRRLGLGGLRGGQLPAYLAPLPARRLGRGCAAPRRAKAHLPARARHREKWRLALEMLDELRAWGLSPPPLVADAGYGEVNAFRAALEERELSYLVEVKAAESAYGQDVLPERPAGRGSGRPPAARYRRPPAALRGLALAAGSAAASAVAWREGSRGTMAARFLALRVRPANIGLRRAHPEGLPLAWLLCQWPEGAAEPLKYWLANLPAETTLEDLVRLAKLRWRIEQDYRELKDALGLEHFEGRSLRGGSTTSRSSLWRTAS